MAMDLKAALKKINEAKVNGGGNYIRPGTYEEMEVQKVIFEEKRKGLSFIVELIVRKVGAPMLYPDDKAYSEKAGKEAIPNKVGEMVSSVINFYGSSEDMAGINVKAFVCALVGANPDTVSEAELYEAIMGGKDEEGNRIPGLRDPEQPAKGMLIKCVAIPIVTKSGKPFTKNNWFTLQQTPESVAERRAAQEGATKAAA